MTMADTVAVMNLGRIEQMGPPAELYELPKTAFVANFLGQSNLLRGTVVEQGDGWVGVDVQGTRIQMRDDRAVSTTGQVVVGVRPEKVHLVREGDDVPAGTNVIGPGRVLDGSFSGVSTQYLIEVPGLGTLGVFVQNLAGGPGPRDGELVRLAWAVEHTFGLDGDQDVHAGQADLDEE